MASRHVGDRHTYTVYHAICRMTEVVRLYTSSYIVSVCKTLVMERRSANTAEIKETSLPPFVSRLCRVSLHRSTSDTNLLFATAARCLTDTVVDSRRTYWLFDTDWVRVTLTYRHTFTVIDSCLLLFDPVALLVWRDDQQNKSGRRLTKATVCKDLACAVDQIMTTEKKP